MKPVEPNCLHFSQVFIREEGEIFFFEYHIQPGHNLVGPRFPVFPDSMELHHQGRIYKIKAIAEEVKRYRLATIGESDI